MKKVIVVSIFLITLNSCKKEDILEPVNSSITTASSEDTNTVNISGIDLTFKDFEGSRWSITYNSFYLNNRYPICPMPYDTLIFEQWYDMGEVYFSNQDDGYLETHTYLIDCAPYYLEGEPRYEPFFNYWSADPDALMKQEYINYSIDNNQIIFNVVSPSQWEYTITLQVVEHTNNTLVLENNNNVYKESRYPTHWNRDVRLELERIN